jgi:hypothetical protein
VVNRSRAKAKERHALAVRHECLLPDAFCLPAAFSLPDASLFSDFNFQLSTLAAASGCVHPDELIDEHIRRAPNAFCARRIVQKNASKRAFLIKTTQNSQIWR